MQSLIVSLSRGNNAVEKTILPVLIAAIVALIGWNIKTTNELQLTVARMEIILNAIAMEN